MTLHSTDGGPKPGKPSNPFSFLLNLFNPTSSKRKAERALERANDAAIAEIAYLQQARQAAYRRTASPVTQDAHHGRETLRRVTLAQLALESRWTPSERGAR
jgi:flagellum-specific peptidoglycan hydrolase FlgJ